MADHDLSEGPELAVSALEKATDKHKAAEQQAFADNWRSDRRRIRPNLQK
jgi:hypothetical protein